VVVTGERTGAARAGPSSGARDVRGAYNLSRNLELRLSRRGLLFGGRAHRPGLAPPPGQLRPDVFLFAAGETVFGLRGPAADTPPGDRFNPCRVGLDHIALGCSDDGELKRVADALGAAGVENSGVKLDGTLGKYYVAFKDPDRIAWEFYAA